jgi:hypothetical protein
MESRLCFLEFGPRERNVPETPVRRPDCPEAPGNFNQVITVVKMNEKNGVFTNFPLGKGHGLTHFRVGIKGHYMLPDTSEWNRVVRRQISPVSILWF